MKTTLFLLSVHRPEDFNPQTSLSETDRKNIDQLNDRMETAGVRFFAGGLRPTSEAKSIRRSLQGDTTVLDGALPGGEHFLDGFWILNCRDMEEAMDWGRQAADACRASVEVRPFYNGSSSAD